MAGGVYNVYGAGSPAFWGPTKMVSGQGQGQGQGGCPYKRASRGVTFRFFL